LEAEAAAPKGPGAKVILRAARRHWWQIALLWLALSPGLMALAYYQIKTVYTASATLRIMKVDEVYKGSSSDANDFLRYQATQVELVRSPAILSTVVADDKIKALGIFRGVDDLESALRRDLDVKAVVGTQLIRITMNSPEREDVRAVVKAVAEAYLEEAKKANTAEIQEQINRLKEEQSKIEVAVKEKQARLLALTKESGGRPDLAASDEATLEDYLRYKSRLTDVQFRLYEQQAELDGLRSRLERGRPAGPGPAGEAEVRRAFQAQQAVSELVTLRAKYKAALDELRRKARNFSSDPTYLKLRGKVDELDQRLDALWKEQKAEIRDRLAQAGRGDLGDEQAVEEAEAKLAGLVKQEELLKETLDRFDVDKLASKNQALEMRFAEADYHNEEQLQRNLDAKIRQLEYEKQQNPKKVGWALREGEVQVDASSNKKWSIMASAPAAVMLLLLAGFTLLETRAGRVADPDDVTARTRVEVLGVVPPLPSLRPQRALWGPRGEYKARRALEEFVQSLDHLRVALCTGPQAANRRCVLITSACGSEGKTTLAAHLAGRCANAGLLTLLVDADLRNPSLSRLLKVPDGPGLVDVLRGEAEPEAAMMVIEAGGGFHLLPAGSPGHDPSRILQGERLAHLVGQFRRTFDVVIVDAPPVLLVPDALIVGRWTDGAILAVRYDTSRFRLLDRANRRLASVGVPVLGAVVNGVRTMESSYYSSYSYSYTQGDGRAGGGADGGPDA
jgi:capsular exopolysaccharide synthesis family protein